jgi:hypothetical protein
MVMLEKPPVVQQLKLMKRSFYAYSWLSPEVIKQHQKNEIFINFF